MHVNHNTSPSNVIYLLCALNLKNNRTLRTQQNIVYFKSEQQILVIIFVFKYYMQSEFLHVHVPYHLLNGFQNPTFYSSFHK